MADVTEPGPRDTEPKTERMDPYIIHTDLEYINYTFFDNEIMFGF